MRDDDVIELKGLNYNARLRCFIATLQWLVLSLLLTNWPFFSNRGFGFWRLSRVKPVYLRLLEWGLGCVLSFGLARALEAQQGPVYPQSWVFYATLFCLFVVLAFPGFAYCYLWRPTRKSFG